MVLHRITLRGLFVPGSWLNYSRTNDKQLSNTNQLGIKIIENKYSVKPDDGSWCAWLASHEPYPDHLYTCRGLLYWMFYVQEVHVVTRVCNLNQSRVSIAVIIDARTRTVHNYFPLGTVLFLKKLFNSFIHRSVWQTVVFTREQHVYRTYQEPVPTVLIYSTCYGTCTFSQW